MTTKQEALRKCHEHLNHMLLQGCNRWQSKGFCHNTLSVLKHHFFFNLCLWKSNKKTLVNQRTTKASKEVGAGEEMRRLCLRQPAGIPNTRNFQSNQGVAADHQEVSSGNGFRRPLQWTYLRLHAVFDGSRRNGEHKEGIRSLCHYPWHCHSTLPR